MKDLVSPPQFFLDYCRICGWSDSETEKAWDEIIQKSLQVFVSRIDEQFSDKTVKEALDKLAKSDNNKGLFARFFALLPEEKQKQFSGVFMNTLVKNLDDFYQTLKQSRTPEQKQALEALINRKEVAYA